MTEPHVFTHEAMKTTFTLRMLSEDARQAQAAAFAGITLIDDIENTLSRYIEGSDVWAINHMQSGESRFLTERCYECLRHALEAYMQTGGLFDITLGQQIEHRKNHLEGAPPALNGQLMVDPDKPAIHCVEAGREIDLGGIGKGYALDQVKLLLQDHGIHSALISAGSSTQLAFGDSSWNIELKGNHNTLEIALKNQALSASGTGVQGSHIVSPRCDATDYAHTRLWCVEKTATFADAWSTANMLMTQDELNDLVNSGALIYSETDDQIQLLKPNF